MGNFKRDPNFDDAIRCLRRGCEKPVLPEEMGNETLPPSSLTPRIQYLLDRIPPKSRVLDLGCGRGEISYYLNKVREADSLSLERDPGFIADCKRIGVAALPVDFNDLNDPWLVHACGQSWDVVVIIDSMTYWRNPAVILGALQDRCEVIYVTVPNPVHLSRRWESLLGVVNEMPNGRGSLTKGGVTWTTDWYNHLWTLKGFQTWSRELGYQARPLARRCVDARFVPLGLFPGLIARSILFELRPEK